MDLPSEEDIQKWRDLGEDLLPRFPSVKLIPLYLGGREANLRYINANMTLLYPAPAKARPARN